MSYVKYLRQAPDAGQFDYESIFRSKMSELGALMLAGDQIRRKNDPSSSTPSVFNMHGQNGLLMPPGSNPLVVSTLVQPVQGMANRMPVLPEPIITDTDRFGGYDVEMITTITGVTEGSDDWADQPVNSCDDPPESGVVKACTLAAVFGRISKKTQVIDRKRVGRLLYRGENADYTLGRNPSFQGDDPFTPSETFAGNWLQDEIEKKIFEMGVGFQRMVAPLTFTANPTNNLGPGARQWSGLDLLINTGKVDLWTGTLCPSMDSLIGSFGSLQITQADANGLYIYDYVENFYRYLKRLAQQTGLAPVKWVIAMRHDLFRALTDIWQIQQYAKLLTQMIAINGTGNGGVINADAKAELGYREQMRSQMFLPIDGDMVEVVVDDAIAETQSAENVFCSQIYFVPLQVMGNVPVTYWHFFNFDNGQGRDFDAMLSKGQTYTSHNGQVLWAYNHRNGCAELMFWEEPRIMMHTPFLAARLQDICYNPGVHSRDWSPDANFYYDGGAINGNFNPPLYPDWSPSTAVNLNSF